MNKYIERFWSKTQSQGDCLVWTGWVNEKGYAYFFDGTRMRRAHRYIFESERRPLEEGETIDHLCKNRSCVKLDHLEPVTHQENCSRGFGQKGKTHCKHGHEFTPENTKYYKTKYGQGRMCRECHKRLMRERRKRIANKEAFVV